MDVLLICALSIKSLQELPQEVLTEKQAMIRKLQTQLRNEEMALVLLKKIRQSQLLAEAAKAAEAAKQAAKEKAAMLASGGQHAKDHTSSSSRHHPLNQQHHHSQGSHHSSSTAHHFSNHSGHHSSKSSGQGIGRPSTSGGGSSTGAINKMTVGQQLNRSREQAALHQHLAGLAGGKNALMPDLSQLKPVNLQDPKNLPPGLPADLVKLMNKGNIAATAASAPKLPNDQQQIQRPPSKPQPKVVDHETPAQKQAAAKLALRQQLEKTLLQVT